MHGTFYLFYPYIIMFYPGFSDRECETQKSIMLGRLSALEQRAYTLAGHPFSLSATEDVAQVY